MATPLAVAGIGNALDVGAGASAGQVPALLAVAEAISAFALQQGDEFGSTDKPGACRLRCSGEGGSCQGAEAKCEEPTREAARLGFVMSIHVGVLGAFLWDAHSVGQSRSSWLWTDGF
ncbi:hypothetical protein [Stenotrophomonas maltophilia]|uniref:hypothetical protein n=1 Tax=Stenotrophomonas maltophilia TaxID=40324 RepID=UPI002E769341|nr:hypothetical protein [Stenotrophomonas maltophilia]